MSLSTFPRELERVFDSGLVVCTLLGPEGPGRRSSSGGCWAVTLDLVVFGRLVGCTGYRPYFENYTVDASILDSCDDPRDLFRGESCVSSYEVLANLFAGALCNFVIKFLSANGECLGIWSRRRTYKSAISLGELIIEL